LLRHVPVAFGDIFDYYPAKCPFCESLFFSLSKSKGEVGDTAIHQCLYGYIMGVCRLYKSAEMFRITWWIQSRCYEMVRRWNLALAGACRYLLEKHSVVLLSLTQYKVGHDSRTRNWSFSPVV
jgi:hypothetical protein